MQIKLVVVVVDSRWNSLSVLCSPEMISFQSQEYHSIDLINEFLSLY